MNQFQPSLTILAFIKSVIQKQIELDKLKFSNIFANAV